MSATSRKARAQRVEDAKNPALFAGLEGEFLGAGEPDPVIEMPIGMKAWRRELDQAIADDVTSAKRLLKLVLLARTDGLDEPQVRENVFDAFTTAGCSQATARQRAADAYVIVTYPQKALDVAVGGSVQTFAASVRKEAKRLGLVQGRTRKAKDGQEGAENGAGEANGATRGGSGDPAGIATLRRALEQVRTQAGSNARALSLLADMADLIDDVAEELLAQPADAEAA